MFNLFLKLTFESQENLQTFRDRLVENPDIIDFSQIKWDFVPLPNDGSYFRTEGSADNIDIVTAVEVKTD